MALVLVLFSVLLGGSALAKDDTPNAHQLALSHPWHPFRASVTEIELACGGRVTRYELRIDDRGWKHLIGAELEVVSTPLGRFLKVGDGWERLDPSGWLAPRDRTLGLRELVGGPLLPEEWGPPDAVASDADATIRVQVHEPPHALVYDPIRALWIASDELRVEEIQRFGGQTLPARIRVGDSCVLRRNVREAAPSMPVLDSLPD